MDYPSLPEQGANLSKFIFEIMKKTMRGDALLVSDEIQKERLDTCKGCEYYDPEQVRCRHCGCFLEQKVKWALDSCPIEKWAQSDKDWVNGKFDELVEHVKNGTEPTIYAGPKEIPPFPDTIAEGIEEGYIFEYDGIKWEFINQSWVPRG